MASQYKKKILVCIIELFSVTLPAELSIKNLNNETFDFSY